MNKRDKRYAKRNLYCACVWSLLESGIRYTFYCEKRNDCVEQNQRKRASYYEEIIALENARALIVED